MGRMIAKFSAHFVLLLVFSLSNDVVVVSAAGGDGQFTYQGFAAANLTVDGLATVTASGLLVLTNFTYQAKAHAFHPAPLRFLGESSTAAAGANASGGAGADVARSFSTAFVFAIVSGYDGLSDHGLAFVVAPTANLSAANAGQYLGFLNATNGTASGQILAVELDTIMNPEFHDISSNHVGIDANSLMSTQARPAGYYGDGDGAFRELRLNSRQPMQVWVDYDGQAKQLNVTLSPVQVPKPKKPLLSQAIDLSTVMAEEMYVGFSSATGVVNTHHYVLGWSFGFDGPAPPLDLSKLPRLPRFGPKPRSKVLDIVLPLATALLVAAVLAAVFFVVWRRRRFAEVREDWEDEFGPHRFAYKDLFRATDGFKDRNLLGVGGFGRVYRGVLPESNLEIAVKRVSHDSRQGIREFVAEVVSIGRLRHRNLVQLLGYCRRKNELLLVYDYMANGSLDKYLHERNVTTLFWPERLWIIKGVASGLLYLHEDWEQVVIHRDIKASNVLLDSAMNGRLGDFGLARLYDHGTDPKTTHVVGTMGYLAPELVRTGKASPLTDVFAFGVFLLEVTCGRRPIETDEHDKRVVLVDLVLEHHRNGSIVGAADPRLTGKFDVEEVALVLKLGLLCSHPLPGARPSMRNVMQYLERGGKSAPDLSPSYVSYSMMAIMQNEGFDSFIMSGGPRLATSIGTVSGASSMTIMSEGR
ncbi:L-type lectin-domain containing receptor kinase SIT2-like [Oryza glaberrima]|uniref:non-specific serine/threonine protein kinase n=1 Tax=Oryza glaberrima TaxID=4538 RepID=I1QEJ1_ORYGL|nr:L-type lectin-domain containing receptor kinase SIT2-like [Oryza glaberrima]